MAQTIGQKITEDIEQEATTIVESPDIMPYFPGCENIKIEEEKRFCSSQKMALWIAKNMEYPNAARKANIEGVIRVKFLVDSKGDIKNIQLMNSLGSGCDEEVLRIMNLMSRMPEKWTPGIQNGQAVIVSLILPIRFKLES